MRNCVLGAVLLLSCTCAAETPVKGFVPYGGSWQVRDGELWAGGGPGPKLISDLPAFAVGEVGVEVFLPDEFPQDICDVHGGQLHDFKGVDKVFKTIDSSDDEF